MASTNSQTPHPARKASSRLWHTEQLIIGHRGAAGEVPENTLPSFQRAVTAGVAAVEFDLYAHSDELVVAHDDTLERTTNGSGALAACDWQTLRRLDAGDGARIPLLAEVVAVVPAHIGLNLELKGPHTAQPVATALQALQLAHPLLVSSFDHAALRTFRTYDSATAVAPLFHRSSRRWQAVAEDLEATAVNLNAVLATPQLVGSIRAAGFAVLAYTVNTEAQARTLFAAGVNGVFTDYPTRLVEVFGQKPPLQPL